MKISHRAAACIAAALVPAATLAQGKPAPGAVDEIVVTGRSVSTSAARVEVERELIVDSANVLKDIPGANVNRNGPLTGIAQYRGMFGDRVSVDIDNLGIIAGGPNAMDAPLSYASPMITSRLVVERGIASVSSAPESVGGHVHAELARGDFGEGDFALSGFVGSRFASNGNVSTTAGRVTAANRSHRLSAVAELDTGDDISTPKGDIRPTRIDRRRYDLSYAFEGGRSGLLVFAGKLDTRETGTPALPMDIRYIDTNLFGAQGDVQLTERLAVELRLAYNDVSHLMDNFALREAPAAMRQRQNLTHGSGYQFDSAARIDLGDSNLRVGIDGIAAEHDSTITNPNMAMFRVDNFVDVERDLLGAYAEWTRNSGATGVELGARLKRVTANAGTVGASGMQGMMGSNAALLADAFNSANRDLDWTAADFVAKLSRRLSDDFEWQIEVGSKTRAPAYQELYLWLPLQATGGLADGRTYVGNLDLDEERSNELVVGFASYSGRFSLAPQLFFKRVDNYIQGMPSGNDVANALATMMSGKPALEWGNVDAEIWGADIAWKYELSDAWYLDGIASAIRGRRTDVADNLYRLAPFNGSIGLTYAASDWSLKTELVAYASQDKVSAYNDEQATPGYGLVNLAFAWSPLASLRFEARVDNLLDKAYQDHVAGINRAGGSDISVGERLYGVERTLSAGLILSF